ncbi:hypothetical protein QL285_094899 [Trifolium repens]|nr:hypothetical protein QL285_094899 [Trifolium repens]
MQLWNKARSFAEETAKRSQQEISTGTHKFTEIIAQTTKEIALPSEISLFKMIRNLAGKTCQSCSFYCQGDFKIEFILVNNHIAPYENQYMEETKLKSSEKVKGQIAMKPLEVELTSNQEVKEVNTETKTSNSSRQQDLDAFLLGDTGSSDDDPDDNNGGFDDDLDKLVKSSDDDKEKS